MKHSTWDTEEDELVRSQTKALREQAQKVRDYNLNVPSEPDDEQIIWTVDDLIPTGSTLANLALSGHKEGGYLRGKIGHMPGDSRAGKSLFALTMCAEIDRLPQFDDYSIRYEDNEEAMLFPVKSMFGQHTYERIEFLPRIEDKGKPRTIQAFAQDLFDGPWPAIIICDSFDGLSSVEDLVVKKKRSRGRKDEDEDEKATLLTGKGGYKTGRAIASSEMFRLLVSKIEQTKSFLFVISQTRANFDPFDSSDKTFTGGNAIKFYRTHESWIDLKSPIMKEVREYKRQIGHDTMFRVTKNRLTGKCRSAMISIYDSYGIDDIGSCVDWMLFNKFWAKQEKSINVAGDFGFEKITRTKLIEHIENNNKEKELATIVEECWNELEAELALKRKPRYT